MKTVALSEVRAMLTEILAAKSASQDSISAALWLGEYRLDGRDLRDLGELTGPFWAVAHASQNTQNGMISIDEGAWSELEGAYYDRVTKPLFF